MKHRIDPNSVVCPLPITAYDTVQLSHGAGGLMSQKLITELFVWAFGNDELSKLNDSAVLQIQADKISFSTDSFVVDPIFFPGGNIGELAVNGTVNDISMSGAVPMFISCAFIIEEGFPLTDLQKIVVSMKNAADKAQVKIVTGDTKVVNKGKGDKLFINTSGIGILEHEYSLGAECLQPGDKIIVSGTIADHGICILSQREHLSFKSEVKSDTASLHKLVQAALRAGGSAIHAFRDPTRGGVAATLNEFAKSSNVGITLREDSIPVKDDVKAACELLGIDPLYVANEGKFITVVNEEKAETVLNAVKQHALGKDAQIIGTVTNEHPGTVEMVTTLGTSRFIDLSVGEQLPRIC